MTYVVHCTKNDVVKQQAYLLTLIGQKKESIRPLCYIMLQKFVECEVLTSKSMKTTLFWNVASCSLLDIDRHFRGVYCRHHQGDDHSDDGSKSKLFWNVSQYLQDYILQRPRRQPSSYSSLLGPHLGFYCCPYVCVVTVTVTSSSRSASMLLVPIIRIHNW